MFMSCLEVPCMSCQCYSASRDAYSLCALMYLLLWLSINKQFEFKFELQCAVNWWNSQMDQNWCDGEKVKWFRQQDNFERVPIQKQNKTQAQIIFHDSQTWQFSAEVDLSDGSQQFCWIWSQDGSNSWLLRTCTQVSQWIIWIKSNK